MTDSEEETGTDERDDAVTLERVSRRYAETRALEDVSLRVREGEFFTLVGPSGCGKTTTLRLLGGFESPDSGTVRLGGTDVSGVPPEDRDIGIVFQHYALFPHLSVRENVGYGLRFSAPPDSTSTEARVDALLELVDLAGLGDRDPDALSGGQQQRVALARALAPGPDVLLLDEPLSALDAELRQRLRVQLQAIQSELDVTTVYVTHDQEEALAISDRVAVMREGRVEQVASPREIYRRPATRFVAEFVGDNNVFSGEVTGLETGADGTTGMGEHGAVATVAVDDDSLTIAVGDRSVSTGDRLVFCVRPDALAFDPETNSLPVAVRGSEFLGDRTRVHLDWRGTALVARGPVPVGGRVAVGFDPAAAHVVTVRPGGEDHC